MINVKNTLIITTAMASLHFSTAAVATDSVHHSGQASKHSALAVSHGAVSTAKVASAVVAVPLIVAGGVSTAAGSAATNAGSAIAKSARDNTTRLEITDRTITVDPAPNQMIIIQSKKQQTENQ